MSQQKSIFEIVIVETTDRISPTGAYYLHLKLLLGQTTVRISTKTSSNWSLLSPPETPTRTS